jgi:hypothetical protein
MKKKVTSDVKNINEQPQTDLSYSIHNPLKVDTELIANRTVNGANNTFYAQPAGFTKAINQLGFNTSKDYIIGVFKSMADKLKGMSFNEGVKINLNEVVPSIMSVFEGKNMDLTDVEGEEFASYQKYLFKVMMNGIACDIRKIKETGVDINEELGMTLDFMLNASNDAKYLFDIDLFKDDIPYLKNEIEKPIKKIPDPISVTTLLPKSETKTPQTKITANNYGIEKPLKLSDIFESISKYSHIMNLLVEKGYCQPNTFLWKDEKKTNKASVVSLIKYLHTQGFYLDNKKPTTNQIKLIAQNTFGVTISESLIKQHKTNEHQVKFIPIASTIV